MRRGPNPMHLVDPERDPDRTLCLRRAHRARRNSLHAPAAAEFLGDVNPCAECDEALRSRYPNRYAELAAELAAEGACDRCGARGAPLRDGRCAACRIRYGVAS